MMRWKRDFGLGLGLLGIVILLTFIFPPMIGGIALLSGFFIAKSLFEEDEVIGEEPK